MLPFVLVMGLLVALAAVAFVVVCLDHEPMPPAPDMDEQLRR